MDKFYSVIRIFFKGDAETHSVEHKSTLLDAQKRYFNIIAADLANEDITYQAAYIIDSNGMMVEGRVFDRTPVVESEATYENA
jgi:hypothetical protein